MQPEEIGMIVLRLLAAVVGLYLIVSMVLAAIKTFILPRPANVGVIRVVFSGVRFLFDLRAKRAESYAERDRLMALYAPAIHFDAVLLRGPFIVLVSLLGSLALVRLRERWRPRDAALAGLAVGLALTINEGFLTLPPLVLLAIACWSGGAGGASNVSSVAGAPPSRRAGSGPPSRRLPPVPTTSCATPTNRSLEPSRIGRSWKRILSRSSKR